MASVTIYRFINNGFNGYFSSLMTGFAYPITLNQDDEPSLLGIDPDSQSETYKAYYDASADSIVITMTDSLQDVTEFGRFSINTETNASALFDLANEGSMTFILSPTPPDFSFSNGVNTPTFETISGVVATGSKQIKVTVTGIGLDSLILSHRINVSDNGVLLNPDASWANATIDEINSTSTAATFTINNLPEGEHPYMITVTDGVYGDSYIQATFISSASISQPPTPPSSVVPCFFGNAPVLTVSGYRRMDSFRAGDRILTPEGAEATVERVKVTQCTAGPFTNPYVIPKGRFGAIRRVLISPNHKVVTDAGLVEAKDLGLEQEEREGTLTYYNLELTGQVNMIISGVAVESLAPVRRMTMTMGQFKAVLQQKYGDANNADVLANVQRTCRILADGRVEVPVLRR